MSAEPITIQLANSSDFDAVTPINLTREQLAVVNQRQYSGSFTGPGGLIRSDFFGLFGAGTAKLVGVAGQTQNRQNLASVLSPQNRIRDQFSLSPTIVYTLLLPGDNLSLRTTDGAVLGTGTTVTLLVNELTESQMANIASQGLARRTEKRRFRLIKPVGAPFLFAPAAGELFPPFVFDPVSELLTATLLGDGPIPIRALTLANPGTAAFVSIRYGNSLAATANLHLIDAITRTSTVLQASLGPAMWSNVFRLSHDDMIGLDAGLPPVGGFLTCDIDVLNANAEERSMIANGFRRSF